MSSVNKQFLLGFLMLSGLTGCVTTNQSASMMDPYDPRNNIPLLQAATRTSGANVPQDKTQLNSKLSSGGNPANVFSNTESTSSSAQKLREIKALKDEGILTQREYETKKSEILKGM